MSQNVFAAYNSSYVFKETKVNATVIVAQNFVRRFVWLLNGSHKRMTATVTKCKQQL
jgi:hypothetical protein